MAAINNAIAKDDEKGTAVRLFIGVLDISTGVLNFCNANHDAPLMVSNELHHLPVEQNIAVGEQRNWEYEPQEIQMLPGTMIFLNTEGLIKVKNKEHRIFNEKRMLGSALQAMKLDPRPKPFIENMLDAVNPFAGDYEQRDDISLLAIRFKGGRKLLQNGAETEPETEVEEEPEVKPWEGLSVGDKVVHKSLGEGEIVSIDENYLFVRFKDRESKFLYPSAFEKGYLNM
jgi:hypothetical protein